MKKVGIVTVNYNIAKDTTDFLHSLKHVKTPDFTLETIVIDNGSKDIYKLPENLKNTTLIRSEINTGFSGGYNIGMKEALKRGTDYVLIVNNDTVMDSDMIQNLLEVLDSKPEIGVTTPKIYFAKGHEFYKDRYKPQELGKIFWFAGGHTDWNNVMSIHHGIDEVDHGQYDKTEEIDFAS